MFFALSLLTVALLMLAERGTAWRERLLNLQVWVVRIALLYCLMPALAYVGLPHLIDASRMPFILGFALFFLVMDLGEYLFHRAQHALPWLWAMHSLHHSDPAMNATTTERHFWGDQFLKAATIWPAAYLLVGPTGAMILLYATAALWNYVAHSDLRLSFGRFSWVLNSPAYHRRHHSALPEHFNSNYAAMLPLWDVIAGSYHRPEGWPPTGLETAPNGISQALLWPWLATRVGGSRDGEPAVAIVPSHTAGNA